MQNPVRSRPCPAARYFLKAVDFDIGGCLLFLFHGKPFQKVRENISNYLWQIEGSSFLTTCSHIIQVRIRKIFCCLFSILEVSCRLLSKTSFMKQCSTFGAVSVKTTMSGQCRDRMPPVTGQFWRISGIVQSPSVLLQKVAFSSVALQRSGQQNF